MGCASSTVKDVVETVEKSDYVFFNKYDVAQTLGEGHFGQVKVAKLHSFNGSTRAVKIFDCGEDNSKLCAAKEEVKIMRLIGKHTNCVQFVEAFHGQSQFYIVMERCRGALLSCFDPTKRNCDDYMGSLFREMLLGVAHLHALRLVHCDVKPDNFLVGEPYEKTVKLCDFGMTCMIPRKGYLKSCRGTAPYMAPEVHAQQSYDFKADVWSMGVSAYQLSFGEFPYMPTSCTPEAMKELILRGVPLPSFTPASSCSAAFPTSSVAEFLQKLLARRQTERCTSQEALRLTFLRPSSWHQESSGCFAYDRSSSFSTDSTRCPTQSSLSSLESDMGKREEARDDFANIQKWLGLNGTDSDGQSTTTWQSTITSVTQTTI